MKLVDGLDETRSSAEDLDQLNRRAELGKGWDAQNGDIVEVEHTLVGVLGEQRVEHSAGLVSVLVEHIALLDVVGPLTPGQRLGIEGDMADEVEGVKVLTQFQGDEVERQGYCQIELVTDRMVQ